MTCSHPFGDFRYNSTCDFGCPEGFERRGEGTLRCLASRQWSAETPTCAGRDHSGLGLRCGTDAQHRSCRCSVVSCHLHRTLCSSPKPPAALGRSWAPQGGSGNKDRGCCCGRRTGVPWQGWAAGARGGEMR